MLQRLAQFGFKMKFVWSQDGDTLFVKLHVPLPVLETAADLLDFNLPLDKEVVRAMAEAGVPDPARADSDGWIIAPIHPNEDRSICKYDPFDYMYAPFDREPRRRRLFMNKITPATHNSVHAHPFSSNVRLKLIRELLYNPRFCGYDLEKLMLPSDERAEADEPGLLMHFAIHNPSRVQFLSENWIRWCKSPFAKEPFTRVKDYFGEQITLYFVFLHHYYKWLLLPASFGLLVQANVGWELNTQAVLVPVFIIFLSFWCVTMLEFWKRRQAEIAVLWGTTEYEETESDRPAFRGKHTTSPVDGSDMLFYPRYKAYAGLAYTYGIVGTLIMGVIAVVVGIFTLRYYMLAANVSTLTEVAPYVASTLNALSIQLLNYLYGKVARHLTDIENHRTDTQYVDALIIKNFAFQFINSYSSFYYIGFIQEQVQGSCGEGITCMDALAINTAIIFAVALTAGNLQEIALPLVLSQWKLKKKVDALEENGLDAMPMVEFQSLLEPYDSLTGSMDDYLELAVQYGYVTLFAAAFPAAPFLAFVSNYVEYRFDALKLLKVFQRPMPRPAEDIGTWQTVFEVITVLAVITNAGLMTFTFDDVWNIEWTVPGRLWTFILFQYFVLGFMFGLAKAIPDVSTDVEIQRRRQLHTAAKLIRMEPDEDDELGSLSVKMSAIDAMIADAVAKLDEPDDEPIPVDTIRDLLPLGESRRKQRLRKRQQGGALRIEVPQGEKKGDEEEPSPIHSVTSRL